MGDLYSPAVQPLLKWGGLEPDSEWHDYRALGLDEGDIPEQLRLLRDSSFRKREDVTSEVWALVHTWRALGQLRAEAAIPALIALLTDEELDDDDWLHEEMPVVLAMIGPAALPAVRDAILSKRHGERGQNSLTLFPSELAKAAPSQRDAAVALTTELLGHYRQNNLDLNAFLVSTLVTLEAVEAVPLIQAAFAARRVEQAIMGDWLDVAYALGLRSEPPPPYTPITPMAQQLAAMCVQMGFAPAPTLLRGARAAEEQRSGGAAKGKAAKKKKRRK